jgi:toxin YhaV
MVVNGWTLFQHTLFERQLEKLITRVEDLAAQEPDAYGSHPSAKLLATIQSYILRRIPQNPGSPEFQQGNTLGKDNRHWFRAKFHGRYRLFFRFSTARRIIIYVWVNDEKSLRKSGAKTDPYAVFESMLRSGTPPQSLDQLLVASRELDDKEFELADENNS